LLLFLAWLLSSNKRKVPWRVLGVGLTLQFSFGFFVLRTDSGEWLFGKMNDLVVRLLSFTDVGAGFVFGDYLDLKFSFALKVLPTIIFFSSLMAVLYHLGVMQRVVQALAWLMQRTMGTSGPETLSASANIFVGQTEAPLVIGPFIEKMTKSELMAVMVGGFATVAGGVMAAYVGMLRAYFPDIAGHLIAASVMSAPAALVCAKLILPETERAQSSNAISILSKSPDANLIDAAARGAGEGMKLALNVGAMLLAFVALVAMTNYLLGLPAMWHNDATWSQVTQTLTGKLELLDPGCQAPSSYGAMQLCMEAAREKFPDAAGAFQLWQPLSLERMMAWVFYPIAWAMGVASEDCGVAATLLGEKLALNEFYAYTHLGQILEAGHSLHPRSVVILTYALCGFANFSSIAIQIGGIGGIAPSRRQELAKLGLRAMIGGTLAAFMTATVAGILI